MPFTLSTDVIIPEISEGYYRLSSLEQNFLLQSGIIVRRPQLDLLAQSGGKTHILPHWKPLQGTRQVITEGVPLTVNRITADAEVAVVHTDGQTFGYTDLSGWLSGDDPGAAIAAGIGGVLASATVNMALATIRGVSGVNEMADSVLTIASENVAGVSNATKLNALTFIDATARLGDRSGTLTHIICHSQTEAALRKQDEVTDIPASDGKSIIKVYKGLRMIIDDRVGKRPGTENGEVFTTVLAGAGLFGMGLADLSKEPAEGGTGTKGVEIHRQALESQTTLIVRRRLMLHPHGCAWINAEPTAQSPEDVDLATPANWALVWERQRVPLIVIHHNN